MYKHHLLSVITIIACAFLFIPLLLIIITSFNSADTISIPLDGFSLSWFGKVFASRSLVSSLRTSLLLALLASCIGLVVGLMCAIAITRKPGKFSSFCLDLFLSPSLIPGIVIGYVLFLFLVVRLKMKLDYALILGHVLVVLPYSVRILSSGLKECDETIEEAAMTLGCNRIQAFVKVVLPDLKPAFLSAFMLSFINSFNNIPVSMYLKGPGKNTLPYAMMNYIEYNYDPTVSALSVMLMGLTLVFMVIIDRVTGTGKGSRA